jgi:tetratricopeptide (TPR) repeat protein
MDLTFGLLTALLATNQPQAVSNLVQQQTGLSVPVPADPNDARLRELMVADDAAIDEVNDWIHTNHISQTNLAAQADLNQRIRGRLDQVKQQYDEFLKQHPDSARGYLAYGSFLNDIGEEDAARTEYENSLQLDPKNPAVWNNLANYYGEFSPVTNAFKDYAEAIRLDPSQPVYYQNFATTVYLFRKDAESYYHITEPEVFDKALDLYRQAIRHDTNNFVLATDYAESYYGIKPLRTNDALAAWTNALQTAHTDVEREGAELHLARVKISVGRWDEARAQLDQVTNTLYGDMKRVLERNLRERSQPAPVTNAPAVKPVTPARAPGSPG